MTPATAELVSGPRSALLERRCGDLLEIVSGARQVRLVFQPLVDLHQGEAVGYEALARFAPRLSVSPTPWFAAAADTPQAAPLEALLVRAALDARAELPRGCFVSINVTPALLPSTEVLRAFGSGGDLSNVVVELTEHARFTHDSRLRQSVSALRQRGARFALDDVGVGWAGLKQVVDLRPDIVKLDRSLVSEAPSDPVRQAIAQMLLDLCSRLGVTLLVEGVETYDELDLFARMGVPLAQGFIFGKPETATRRLIDDDLAVRLKFRAGLTRHQNKIAGHVDVTAPTAVADSDLALGAADDELSAVAALVLVDGLGRPTALVMRNPDGVEQHHAVMSVIASEDVAGAVRRAMTRPHLERFLPLVCVDRSGQYVGLVRVESLMLALTDSPGTQVMPVVEVRLP